MFRLSSTLTALGLAAFLAAGCQQGETLDETGEMEKTVDVTETDPGLDETATDEERTSQVDLEAVDGSGVTGVTSINHRADGAVEIVVDLEGATEGTLYEGHLHRGTCAEGLGELQALEAFTLSGGAATSTTVVPANTLDPNETEYFVEVHAPAGTVVACSDMPQHEHSAGAEATGTEWNEEPATKTVQ